MRTLTVMWEVQVGPQGPRITPQGLVLLLSKRVTIPGNGAVKLD